MRTAGYSLLATVLFATGGRPVSDVATECSVKGAYRSLDVPSGTIALSGLGDALEVDLLLAPAKLESGAYDVTVTRKGKDIYRADGTTTYIATRYCYEYAYSERAVLRYTALGTIGSGTLVFAK